MRTELLNAAALPEALSFASLPCSARSQAGIRRPSWIFARTRDASKATGAAWDTAAGAAKRAPTARRAAGPVFFSLPLRQLAERRAPPTSRAAMPRRRGVAASSAAEKLLVGAPTGAGATKIGARVARHAAVGAGIFPAGAKTAAQGGICMATGAATCAGTGPKAIGAADTATQRAATLRRGAGLLTTRAAETAASRRAPTTPRAAGDWGDGAAAAAATTANRAGAADAWWPNVGATAKTQPPLRSKVRQAVAAARLAKAASNGFEGSLRLARALCRGIVT